MAGLLTVITDDDMTGFSDVAGLVPVTTRTRLSLVEKMLKGLAKT